MQALEFTGKTTEEALQKACEHFDLPLDRLEVEVISAGSTGLFGFLGAKKAKIKVRPSAGNPQEDLAEMVRFVSEKRPLSPLRTSVRETPAKPEEERTSPAPAVAKAAPAPVSKPGPEPAPAPVQPSPNPAAPAAKPAPAALKEPYVPPSEDDLDLSESENGDEEDLQPADGERIESDPKVQEQAREVLVRLIAHLDPGAVITQEFGENGILLDINGNEAGVLIGRRGQTLDAIQYLTTRIVSHSCGRPVRITVDAGGYRQRRRESLEELASRMAEKAKATGRSVAIGPMTAQERRLVHLALRDQQGISTSSRGRGELKKVIIVPRG